MPSKTPSFLKALTPLAIVQFVGVFNDYAYKWIVIITVTWAAGTANNYSQDGPFIAVITIVFVLPFILFAELSGYFSDRYSKKNVIILSKISELIIMLAGTLALANYHSWGATPLVVIMFFMAAQSTFLSPAFNGLLPETFEEQELSHANGNVNLVTFSAVILGTAAAFVLKKVVGEEVFKCGLLFSILSVLSVIAATRIIPGIKGNRQARWNWNIITSTYAGLKQLWSLSLVFIAVLSDAFFLAYCVLIQSIVVIFGKYTLGIGEEQVISMGILQLSPAFGIGFGSWLAGRFSGKKIELGLVPLGAVGMIIFPFLIAAYYGKAWWNTESLVIYPNVLIYLVALGVFGGFFIVPLRATQQFHIPEKIRGTVLAYANFVCFVVIMLASVALLFLTGGGETAATSAGSTSIFSIYKKYAFNLSTEALFCLTGLSVAVVCLVVFCLYPIFLFRCFIVVITNTLYKVRIRGSENIPERGPVLLVSNHVSFVDPFLIMACTSRQVRFLMHEDFYNYPLLKPFVRWSGFIKVPPTNQPKRMQILFDEVKDCLHKGEMVCVFPEGRITRNGIMDEFRKCFSEMVPDDLAVPVIPVRLGMIWGSIFSYYYGKIVLRIPHEIPHPAAVTIGTAVPKTLTPYEMRRVISEMAAETEMEPRYRERPIHYKFAKYAKWHPFGSIIVDHSGESFSNFKVLVASIILSRKIRKLAGDSQYVGLLMPNCAAADIGILAILTADKVPAMLNFTASKETLDACVKNAAINTILTSKMFIHKAKIEQRDEMVFVEDLTTGIAFWQRFLTALAVILVPHQELMNFLAPESHRDVFRTAILLFSSGSTSVPKGILLSHHNINSNVYCCLRIMGWNKTDSILANLPLFHSFGITTCFWLPLMIGAKLVNISNPLDIQSVGDAIEKHKLKVMLATPTFLQAYMRKNRPEQFASVRLIITGAEKLRMDIADRFKKFCGKTVMEGYGCTELSPIVSINIGNSFLNLGTEVGHRGSVGVAMPGICAKVVDPYTYEELPPDTEGLLFIKGPNVMQGYLNEPERTAEVIINGWYNTGDMAKIASDGYIRIVGRLSRFSKIGGEMVPHEMVEMKIYEVLQTEKRCLVVCGGKDKAKGERLVIYYTDELPMTPEEIVEKLRNTGLPNLWIPKAQNFYGIDEIPILGSGKLDLRELSHLNPDELKKDQSQFPEAE